MSNYDYYRKSVLESIVRAERELDYLKRTVLVNTKPFKTNPAYLNFILDTIRGIQTDMMIIEKIRNAPTADATQAQAASLPADSPVELPAPAAY